MPPQKNRKLEGLALNDYRMRHLERRSAGKVSLSPVTAMDGYITRITDVRQAWEQQDRAGKHIEKLNQKLQTENDSIHRHELIELKGRLERYKQQAHRYARLYAETIEWNGLRRLIAEKHAIADKAAELLALKERGFRLKRLPSEEITRQRELELEIGNRVLKDRLPDEF